MIDVNSGQHISQEEMELAQLRMCLGHEYSLATDKKELVTGQDENGEPANNQEGKKEDSEAHIKPNTKPDRRFALGMKRAGGGYLPSKDSLEGV
jgi:hypothetical protein